MSLKIYIPYGTAEDQVTALRLQALAAVHGLTAYVPPASTRRPATAALDAESTAQLESADVLFGLVGFELASAWRQELDLANRTQKPVVLIGVAEVIASPDGMKNVQVLDPAKPGEALNRLDAFLEKTHTSPAARKALRALGTVALGLLMFAHQG